MTLVCKEFEPEKKTAQNIQMKIVCLLTSLGFCVSDIQTKGYFVTDCGANIKCALKNYNWYPCSAHVANTVLFLTLKFMLNHSVCDRLGLECYLDTDASSTSDESNTTLKQMVVSCKELVAYFKRIGEIEGVCTLKQEVETRWNSKYTMLQSILKECKICDILHKKGGMHRLQNIDFGDIQALCTFLEPFKEAFEILEGSLYVTFHGVLLMCEKFERILEVHASDRSFICDLKKTAKDVCWRNFRLSHFTKLQHFSVQSSGHFSF